MDGPATTDSARLLDTMLEHTVEGIALFDADLRLILGNRRSAALTGVDPALLRPGTPLRDILIWQYGSGELGSCADPVAAAEHALRHNRIWVTEPTVTERVRPNGQVIERRTTPIPGGGFVTIYLDVTERRRAEIAARELAETLTQRVAERTAALAASEERMRRIVETALDAVFTTDAAGCVTGWNPQAEAMFGWPAADAIGRELAALLLPPVERPRLAALFGVPETGDAPARTLELRALRRDGRVVDVALRMTSFVIDGALCWSGFVSDVTARKSAELALQAVRTSLQEAVEAMEHGIALFDAEDRLLLYNAVFADHFAEIADLLRLGVTHEALMRAAVERGTIRVPPEADREAWIAERVALHRSAERETHPRVLKDGRILEVTKRRSRNGGILSIGIDVTERRAMEQQLREAQKMEAIGKLTGGMAHDFNNYLSTIVGNLELAGDAPELSADTRSLIEQALSGAFSAAELTRSLLAFARRQALDPRTTDVNRRVAAIAGLLARTLGEDVELTTRLATDLWPVRIDGAQLDSCIVNLANNARDAMPRGGRLTIATRNVPATDAAPDNEAVALTGDHVLIEIADTGAGMTPVVLASAFEPFFTTKGPGHGTGLGLSMVYGFVKQSGGHVQIDSAPGAGTVVRLRLPRDVAGLAAEVPSRAAPALPGGDESVLVVEDDDRLRRTVAAQLAGLGYRVVPAASGPAALAILDDPAQAIDLLFTDIVMPGGLDGHALGEQARARRPDLCVLLTSGYAGGDAGGSGAGLPGLLGKPYRKLDLARAVRAALDARGPRPPRGGIRLPKASGR